MSSMLFLVCEIYIPPSKIERFLALQCNAIIINLRIQLQPFREKAWRKRKLITSTTALVFQLKVNFLDFFFIYKSIKRSLCLIRRLNFQFLFLYLDIHFFKELIFISNVLSFRK